MTAAAEQIKSLYEISGLSIVQIAEIEKLELTAVKAILYQSSPKYRQDIEAGKEEDFNEQDNALAMRVFRRVAEYSDDDATALKAAMFIRNDKKGRLDAKSGLKKLNINVTVLNEHFAKAAAAIADKVLPKQLNSGGPITDV